MTKVFCFVLLTQVTGWGEIHLSKMYVNADKIQAMEPAKLWRGNGNTTLIFGPEHQYHVAETPDQVVQKIKETCQ